jgi:Uma2 family endonuclease
MAISERRMTLEEFLALPEVKPALELVAGRVSQKVSPQAIHGRLQLWLGSLFAGYGEPGKLAMAFTETRVTFAGDSLVPDVVVYRWHRIQCGADGEIVEDFTTPPDIAIEIVSPGQSVRGQHERCRWCVENGVEIALCVNPRARVRSVTLFRAGSEPVVLTGNDRIPLDSVLPGFELTVAELFAALRP